jgi:hypothetical protein
MAQISKYFGWLKVVPLWVGLMTGLLSLVREIAVTFVDSPNPLWQKKVFWSCVWIAFVISSIWAWIQEHNKFLAERYKNELPEFKGEILDFQLEPHSSDGMLGDIDMGNIDGSVVTVKVYFVNKRKARTTIRGFKLLIEIEGERYFSRYADEEPLFRFPISQKELLFNLNDYVKDARQFRRNKGVNGFLRFTVKGLIWKEEFIGKPIWPTVIITDALGEKHLITEFGERPRPSERIRPTRLSPPLP